MKTQFDTRYRVLLSLFTAVMVLGLSACGGGNGNSANPNIPATITTNTTSTSGQVAVMLTDAPTAELQHINVTVTQVQLLGSDGPQTLYSGEKTFDLLALSSHAEMFSLADVAPGAYNKIRLTLKDVELVRQDTSGVVIERIHPKLPGNGKLDLNPRGPFVVTAGQTLYLQLDMDAAKSIHIAETGSGKYIFRPVIFVDVLTTDVPGKIVRLHGNVQQIDLAAQRFLVCHPQLTARHLRNNKEKDEKKDEDDDHDNEDASVPQATGTDIVSSTPSCVSVQIGEGTSVFGLHGDPARLSDMKTDNQVTVLGRFLAPISDDNHGLIFHAAVIEFGPTGTFTHLQGSVQSVDEGRSRFVLELTPGQGFTPGTTLQVNMQEDTKVFTRQGAALVPMDIHMGAQIKVEGVLVLSNTEVDEMKAALVFVETDLLEGLVSATLGQIDVIHNSFTVITPSGDRCVTLAAGGSIFEIGETPTGFMSDAVTLSQLEKGQRVDIYGRLGLGGCYIANHVLATAP